MAMVISFLLILLSVGCIAELSPVDYEIDAKDAFFRRYRSYDIEKQNLDADIPQPGGLPAFFDNTRVKRKTHSDDRLKRSYHVLPSPGLTSHFITEVNKIHKKAKRHAILPEATIENVDGSVFGAEQPAMKRHEALEQLADEVPELVINDFIRFKREAETEAISDSSTRLKREPEIKTEKMIMERDYIEGADREPRGATKEQWIKQPYPVERPVDDNVSSASDTIRAPRVHFVTQRRQGGGDSRQAESQSRPQLQPPSYHRAHDEREGRARDFDPYAHALPQAIPYPYPRPRSYDPYRPRYYDPYYDSYDSRRYPYDAYDSRYKYDLPEGRPMQPNQPLPPSPSTVNKQRRIIYYATLPEVVRSPTNSDNRFRYHYQDVHDERYVGGAPAMPAAPLPGPANGSTDPYRIRKSYNNQLQHQRDYERPNTERKKTPLYPVKVSTDVNVREPKKSPERRIYSDVDRRYNYKAPSFQTAEDGNF